MERLVASLLVVLLVPGVAAFTDVDTDREGDVMETLDKPTQDGRIDLLQAFAEYENGTLDVSMQIAGSIPTPQVAEAWPNQTLTYLFVVGLQEADRQSLQRNHDLSLVCTMHPGVASLSCDATQDGFVLRKIGAQGSWINVTLDVPDPSLVTGLVVGAGATAAETTDNETVLLGQDFTPQADPFGGSGQGEDHEHGSPASDTARGKPWWQSGWLLLAAAVLGVALGYWYNQRKAKSD